MPSPYQALKNRLQLVLAGKASQRELTDLVHISRAIVQSHLEKVRRQATWLCEHQGITVEDLAFDCLGDAFRRDASGRFAVLEAFSHSLASELESTPEIEVLLAYRALLSKVANQQLARLFAEVDPVGGRILRNLKEAVKRSEILSLERDLRGLIIRPKHLNSRDELDAFPTDELARRLLGQVQAKRSSVEIVQGLFRVMKDEQRYRRSIPLVELTAIVKKLFAEDLEQETGDGSLEGLSPSDLEVIRSEVETVIRQKVLVTYVMRGKIGAPEARAIFEAFHDLLGDWIANGPAADGLMSYLGRHLTVDEDAYRREYRPKMEYLLRLAREEFEAQLMREL